MYYGDVSADAGNELVCGELTAVVRVSVVDVNGHAHEFTLTVDEADDLAAHLRLAVEDVPA